MRAPFVVADAVLQHHRAEAVLESIDGRGPHAARRDALMITVSTRLLDEARAAAMSDGEAHARNGGCSTRSDNVSCASSAVREEIGLAPRIMMREIASWTTPPL